MIFHGMIPISSFNLLLQQQPKWTMDVICNCMLEAYVGPSPEHFTIDGLLKQMMLDQQQIAHIPIGNLIYNISILGLMFRSRINHPIAIDLYKQMVQEWNQLVLLVKKSQSQEPSFLTNVL